MNTSLPPLALPEAEVVVDDVHSQLNATPVAAVVSPRSAADVRALISNAARTRSTVSISGARHAMGGQQFARHRTLIDMRRLNRLLAFDAHRGLLTVEAGADWPTVIRHTHDAQHPGPIRWGIRQKQTGADDLTLGGAISANAHGRGLLMGPLVDDIEDLTIVDADANEMTCSRTAHPELFRLVIGGYGLFGVIIRATLRLGPRMKLRRLVDIIDIDDAMNAVERRVKDGCIYGDFQYAIDPADPSFLRRGVMACYEPAHGATAVTADTDGLSRDRWLDLLHLAHTDKHRAFQLYAQHYLSTHGQTYWSDTMQLSTYIPSYAEFLAARTSATSCDDPAKPRHTLVIGEHAVPPNRLVEFLALARDILRHTHAEDIYGTIRSLRADSTTLLPFARTDSACVIFNLRTEHTPEGIERTHETFRRLTDAGLSLGGSFFLTYHRAATIQQIRAAYPALDQFIAEKHARDPNRIFTSDWFEHLERIAHTNDCVRTHA